VAHRELFLTHGNYQQSTSAQHKLMEKYLEEKKKGGVGGGGGGGGRGEGKVGTKENIPPSYVPGHKIVRERKDIKKLVNPEAWGRGFPYNLAN